MSRNRDLSGFAAVSEPTGASTATAERPRITSRRAASRKASATIDAMRINISLPVPTAGLLKAKAEAEHTYYLDIVRVAHGNYAARTTLWADDDFRRRRAPGRVQVPVNVPRDLLDEIESAARAKGQRRSAYLCAALEAYLQ